MTTGGREPEAGGVIRALATIGTVVFAASAIAGAIAPDAFATFAALVAGLLFVIGCGAFLWAYGIAVGRSRTDAIGIGGLFFLQGSAPAPVRRHLLVALAVQVVVAIVTASVRIYTALAFGWLAPVFGLGLAGLWGARHGTFPARRATNETASDDAPAHARDDEATDETADRGDGPSEARVIDQNGGHGRSDDRTPDDPRLA